MTTLRLLAALAMIIGALQIFVPTADAVHDTGAFELDGNATHGTTDDWENVCHEVTITNDTSSAIPNECATASDTAGATAVSWTNDGALNASIFTGGGSKDPQDISQWAWKDGAGGLPDKDNLLHSFAARYSLTPSAHCPSGGEPTCEVLFFGSDRYDNSGDAQQGFWFFQNEITLGSNAVGGGTGFTGVHREGDILVISDFSNGGTTSTITVYEWNPTECPPQNKNPNCGDVNLLTLETSTTAKCASTLGDGDPFCGIVNPGPSLTTAPWSFTDKSGNHNYLNGELYEGGVNLSLLGLGDRCFSSVASETRSSTSTTATLKDFVLGGFGKCEATLVTTPKKGDGTAIPSPFSIGTGSVSVKDSASLTVEGTPTWDGTLSFHLCGPITAPATCDTGGTAIGSAVAVDQDTVMPVLSSAATVTSAGRYCWRGDFTPSTDAADRGVPEASDSSTGECFTVSPVTPPLDTQAVASPVDFGQAVQDNATLSGTATRPGTNGPNSTYPSINATNGAAAGGKITFTLLKSDCSTLATGTGTNPQDVTTISGNGTYGPVSFTPDAPGTYHWKAQYIPATGDPNNLGSTHNGSCDDSDETVVVNQVQTGITTRQFVFPQDKATITASGGGNLAGSVSFKLYNSSANCAANGATGLLYSEGPLAVSGASPQSKTTNNTTVRVASDATLYWRVTYSSTNQAQLGSSSTCTEITNLTYSGNDGTIAIP